jgi:hypothetical protein
MSVTSDLSLMRSTGKNDQRIEGAELPSAFFLIISRGKPTLTPICLSQDTTIILEFLCPSTSIRYGKQKT